MELTDLLPLEKWLELEEKVYAKCGMTCNIFNIVGYRITDFHKWPNRLCPVIKANDKGQSFICAVAHMNLAAQAKQNRQPLMEECDAGMVKIVVPVFVEDEFLGAFGACGLLLDDGEVDSFLVNKITEIEEETVEELSTDIGAVTTQQANELMAFIAEEIDKIVKNYESQKQS